MNVPSVIIKWEIWVGEEGLTNKIVILQMKQNVWKEGLDGYLQLYPIELMAHH